MKSPSPDNSPNSDPAPEPLDFQVDAVDHIVKLLSRPGSACAEASGTGFGKTFVACFAAKRLNLPLAVICPKSVRRAWLSVARSIGCRVLFVENYESAVAGKVPYGSWPIKKKRFQWDFPEEALLVFDEAHRAKNRKAQRTKLLTAVTRCPNLRVMLVSATLAEDPRDMYATGQVLGLHSGDSEFYHWLKANGCKKGRFGMIYTGGVEAMRDLHARIFPDLGHRVSVADIPGFPRNQVSTLAVEAVGTPRVQKSLEALTLKALDDKRLPIIEVIRARQSLELLKCAALESLARDTVDSGCSAVIFVNFTETLNVLQEVFTGKCAVVHGGQSDAEREAEVGDFQSNRRKIIIVQIQAGGEGIGLHDLYGRPRVSFISPPNSVVQLVQALGRINRAGALSPAVQRLVFVADSEEEKVRHRVEMKLKNIAALNDGDLDMFIPTPEELEVLGA